MKVPRNNERPPEPTVQQHRAQAEHNDRLIQNGAGLLPPDWEVTVRFYAVAHWVRAFIKTRLSITVIEDHYSVDGYLRQAGVQADIRDLYKRLRTTSEDFRYYCIMVSYNPPMLSEQLSRARQDYDRLKRYFEPKTR